MLAMLACRLPGPMEASKKVRRKALFALLDPGPFAHSLVAAGLLDLVATLCPSLRWGSISLVGSVLGWGLEFWHVLFFKHVWVLFFVFIFATLTFFAARWHGSERYLCLTQDVWTPEIRWSWAKNIQTSHLHFQTALKHIMQRSTFFPSFVPTLWRRLSAKGWAVTGDEKHAVSVELQQVRVVDESGWINRWLYWLLATELQNILLQAFETMITSLSKGQHCGSISDLTLDSICPNQFFHHTLKGLFSREAGSRHVPWAMKWSTDGAKVLRKPCWHKLLSYTALYVYIYIYMYICSWTPSRDRQSAPPPLPMVSLPPPKPRGGGLPFVLPSSFPPSFPPSCLLSLLPFSFFLSSFPPSFEAMSAVDHHHRGRRCFATLLQSSKPHLLIEPFFSSNLFIETLFASTYTQEHSRSLK